MKPFSRSFAATLSLCSALGSGLASPSAHAFTLKFLDSQDVSDANYCGDFNKLGTYQMDLDEQEKVTELGWTLLSRSNIDLIKQEMKARFLSPKLPKRLVIREVGQDALKGFASSWSDVRDNCYGVDFAKLFSYTLQDGKLTLLKPARVLYVLVAYETFSGGPLQDSALVVMDRDAGRLYIHQEW